MATKKTIRLPKRKSGTMIISCCTGATLDSAPQRMKSAKKGIACYTGSNMDQTPQNKYKIYRKKPAESTCSTGDYRSSGVFRTDKEKWE